MILGLPSATMTEPDPMAAERLELWLKQGALFLDKQIPSGKLTYLLQMVIYSWFTH